MLSKGENVLSTKQFDKESLVDLLETAKKMEGILDGDEVCKLAEGKILGTLFFEPSTRTRFSFEAAMNRLGGAVISGADMMANSSVKKRETLGDTGKIVSQYCDVIAMRHPEAGSVAELAEKSDVPVLNGGDGSNEHPTQGLLDLYTIWSEKGTLDGLTVGMGGDLKYSRVFRSQCDLLKYFDVKFVFVSPPGLVMKEDVIEELKSHGRKIEVAEDYESVIGEMDVINCSRIQEERFDSPEEGKKYVGVYVMDNELMSKAKEDAILMHPLPRVGEIAEEVDADPRALYFKQARNGVIMRMALISKVLGLE